MESSRAIELSDGNQGAEPRQEVDALLVRDDSQSSEYAERAIRMAGLVIDIIQRPGVEQGLPYIIDHSEGRSRKYQSSPTVVAVGRFVRRHKR